MPLAEMPAHNSTQGIPRSGNSKLQLFGHTRATNLRKLGNHFRELLLANAAVARRKALKDIEVEKTDKESLKINEPIILFTNLPPLY